jgi:hypothetical protein
VRRDGIVEHVFERFMTLRPDRESVVERELALLLDGAAAGVAGYPIDLVTPEGRVRRAGGAPMPVPVDEAIGSHGRPSPAEAGEAASAAAGGPSSERALAERAARVDARVAAGAEQLERARGAHVELARAAAERARAVARFARSRPASLDRPDGEVGAAAAATRAGRPAVLTPVSEWAVDEVAVALSLTGAAATRVLVESLLLDERLPATLAALDAGVISEAHARVMCDLVAGLGDAVRPVAEARLLSRVAGTTPAQLRVAARRVVQQVDAAAVAERMAQAIRDRRVSVYPGEDGMATLSAVLPAPVARAVRSALEQYADTAVTEGDQRTRAQRMADCLVDLVLRPGEHGLAPVQARLTVVATVRTLLGGDEPGEVDGDLVPAEMVRQLAEILGLMPAVDVEDSGGAASDQGRGTSAADRGQRGGTSAGARGQRIAATDPGETTTGETTTGETGACDLPSAQGRAPARERQAQARELRSSAEQSTRAGLAELLGVRRLAGTALGHRPRVAVVDELRGQLLALTDATGLRRGRPLGPPPPSPGYRPGEALDRFVRSRDRRCRFPGCRARPIRADLDHTVPWPAGPTSAANLTCLCRHHHRLSHQAPGWRLRVLPDGGLEWTTPTGQVLTTHPPRYGTDDDLPYPAPATVSGAAGDRPGEYGATRDQASTVSADDDLPPF